MAYTYIFPFLQPLLTVLDLLHSQAETPPRLLSLVKPGQVLADTGRWGQDAARQTVNNERTVCDERNKYRYRGVNQTLHQKAYQAEAVLRVWKTDASTIRRVGRYCNAK